MPDVYIDGKRVRLDPKSHIGKGGEADVYAVGSSAVKLYKGPDHPDLSGDKGAQEQAKQRLKVQQRKLRDFPRQLPAHVVVPTKLALNREGNRILGYAMPQVLNAEALALYGDRSFRAGTIGNDGIGRIFRDLYSTVKGLHLAKVVIGDFNDLNVLVSGEEAYVIDADSFQFGPYPGGMFTPKFTDPLLCDPKATSLMLSSPQTSDSDWYAYAIMLFNSLLFVDPYGGVYRPRDPTQKVNHDARPLKRITVFHSEVRYPKPATHYNVLPDELCEFFLQMFTQDKRGEFPINLLDNLRWTTCTVCGQEHARTVCPNCKAAGLVKETIRVRGTVRAHKIFATRGKILASDIQNGKLVWLAHEHDEYRREDNSMVASGALNRQARYRVAGSRTVVALGNQALVLDPKHSTKTLAVDRVGNLPTFDTSQGKLYWVEGGTLYREGRWERETIGQTLAHQTLFWTGSQFGFGLYRAGELTRAFVFDCEGKAINDGVVLPRLPDQLIDMTATFSDEYCWFFVRGRSGGNELSQCIVLNARGEVVGSTTTDQGDHAWLNTIRGHFAAGNFLLAATDDGIARIELVNSQCSVTREFPDTEPFVQADSKLLAGKDGVYVVGAREIWQLQIS